MTHTGILTRVEIESMGPPVLEELREADVPASFLCDLALKHVAQMPEPTTRGISEALRDARTRLGARRARAGAVRLRRPRARLLARLRAHDALAGRPGARRLGR